MGSAEHAMTTDVELLLEGIPVFSQLSPESLEDLEHSLTRRGEYLFRQGEGPPPNVSAWSRPRPKYWPAPPTSYAP